MGHANHARIYKREILYASVLSNFWITLDLIVIKNYIRWWLQKSLEPVYCSHLFSQQQWKYQLLKLEIRATSTTAYFLLDHIVFEGNITRWCYCLLHVRVPATTYFFCFFESTDVYIVMDNAMYNRIASMDCSADSLPSRLIRVLFDVRSWEWAPEEFY